EAVKITYDKNTGVFELDRSQSGELPNNQDNQKRSVQLFDALKSLKIFIDTSSIEIFINEGTHVMTSRLFPVEPYQYCQLSSESGTVKMETKQYELKRG
ncbi:MAG: GH32 C-terminal domain-containing protein, partial [Staphylococcus simulans]|nr:GH32 C-terminal domain-containing protein [Staphylococcus simulans]